MYRDYFPIGKSHVCEESLVAMNEGCFMQGLWKDHGEFLKASFPEVSAAGFVGLIFRRKQAEFASSGMCDERSVGSDFFRFFTGFEKNGAE
jgi:hypothetical protein